MKHTKKLLIFTVGAVGAVGLATAGWAYWSAGGSGTATATVGTLNAPTIGTTTQPTPGVGTLRVNWTASTGAVAPTGYYVQRFVGSILDGPACASSPSGLVAAPSCDDEGLTASGPYNYKVTAMFRSWTAQSAASNAVTVVLDATPPTVSSINRAEANPTNAGSVSWTVTFSEPVTGVDTSDFALARQFVTGGSVTAVVGSNTTWTVTSSTGTGDGTLGLNLVDNDSIVDGVGNKLGGAGNGNGNKTGAEYSIDKTAPTALSIIRSGSSPTNATAVSWTVTFNESVTGADNSDFQLVGTAASQATITAAQGLTFTVTADTAGDGALGLNLVDDDTVVDSAGNKLGGTGAGNGNVTGEIYSIDKTSPTVTLAAPVSGMLTSDATPTLSGTAGNGIGDSSTVTVKIYSGSGTGGTVVQTLAPSRTGTAWSADAAALSDGQYTAQAAQTDNAGNTGSSGANTFTIDATAPAAPPAPDLAAASDSGSSNSDNITNVTAPTFTGTAEAGATVKILDGATHIGTGTATGGNYTIATSGIGTGSRTITATATDAASNTSTGSSGLTITVDTTAPAAPSAPDLAVASDSGSSSSDNITNDTTPTFTGTAEAGASVKILDGATQIGTGTATGGNYTITTSGIGTGSRTITATATDPAGNTSTGSTGLTVTVDTTAPVLVSASSANVGATAGRMQATDTLTLTFSEALNPNSVPTTATVTEQRSGSSTLTIPGVISAASINNNYLGGNNSSGSATGTVVLSNGGKTITITLGTVTTTGSGVVTSTTGSTVSVEPAATITDIAGNSGSTESASITRLF